MIRLFIISSVLIFGLTSFADAKKLRVLKSQQNDIAKFKRAVQRGSLHSSVKRKVIKAIDRAMKKVTRPIARGTEGKEAGYRRLHTQFSKYGGSINMNTEWGKSIAIYFSASGNYRANQVKMFKHAPKKSWGYHADRLTDKLTFIHAGGNSSSWTGQKTIHKLYTTQRQKSTGLSHKLGTALSSFTGLQRNERQVFSAKLENLMSVRAHKGLTINRAGEPSVMQTAPAPHIELNVY